MRTIFGIAALHRIACQESGLRRILEISCHGVSEIHDQIEAKTEGLAFAIFATQRWQRTPAEADQQWCATVDA